MRVAAAFTRDAAQLRRRRGLRAALGDRRPSRDLPRRAPRPPRALDGGSRDRAPPGDAPRCRWTLAPGLRRAPGRTRPREQRSHAYERRADLDARAHPAARLRAAAAPARESPRDVELR